MAAEQRISSRELAELARVGYQAQERAGSFVLADSAVVQAECGVRQLEMLPLAEAMRKYEWLQGLSFGLVDRERDEYTAAAANQPPTGYFIRVFAGHSVALPLQTCFFIRTPGMRQVIHNVLVAEAGAEVHLIHGCATASHLEAASHIGVTECYVGEGATVTSTMIHSWAPGVEVFPRSAARVAKGGRFISNYVALTPVRRLDMCPEVVVGENALGEFYSVVYAPAGSSLDLGGTARLRGAGASAEIISRVVSDGGAVVTRGHIVGETEGVRGVMACNGLLLGSGGSIHAIPELEARAPRVQLSHEASVGMISPEELSYLMASGMDEEAARSLIMRGFLDVRVRELPDTLKQAIAAVIERAKIGKAV
jgi:hypothetical protein